jgi:hypothetical protein
LRKSGQAGFQVENFSAARLEDGSQLRSVSGGNQIHESCYHAGDEYNRADHPPSPPQKEFDALLDI